METFLRLSSSFSSQIKELGGIVSVPQQKNGLNPVSCMDNDVKLIASKLEAEIVVGDVVFDPLGSFHEYVVRVEETTLQHLCHHLTLEGIDNCVSAFVSRASEICRKDPSDMVYSGHSTINLIRASIRRIASEDPEQLIDHIDAIIQKISQSGNFRVPSLQKTYLRKHAQSLATLKHFHATFISFDDDPCSSVLHLTRPHSTIIGTKSRTFDNTTVIFGIQVNWSGSQQIHGIYFPIASSMEPQYLNAEGYVVVRIKRSMELEHGGGGSTINDTKPGFVEDSHLEDSACNRSFDVAAAESKHNISQTDPISVSTSAQLPRSQDSTGHENNDVCSPTNENSGYLYMWYITNPKLSTYYYCCGSLNPSPLPPAIGWRRMGLGKLPGPRLSIIECPSQRSWNTSTEGSAKVSSRKEVTDPLPFTAFPNLLAGATDASMVKFTASERTNADAVLITNIQPSSAENSRRGSKTSSSLSLSEVTSCATTSQRIPTCTPSSSQKSEHGNNCYSRSFPQTAEIVPPFGAKYKAPLDAALTAESNPNNTAVNSEILASTLTDCITIDSFRKDTEEVPLEQLDQPQDNTAAENHGICTKSSLLSNRLKCARKTIFSSSKPRRSSAPNSRADSKHNCIDRTLLAKISSYEDEVVDRLLAGDTNAALTHSIPIQQCDTEVEGNNEGLEEDGESGQDSAAQTRASAALIRLGQLVEVGNASIARASGKETNINFIGDIADNICGIPDDCANLDDLPSKAGCDEPSDPSEDVSDGMKSSSRSSRTKNPKEVRICHGRKDASKTDARMFSSVVAAAAAATIASAAAGTELRKLRQTNENRMIATGNNLMEQLVQRCKIAEKDFKEQAEQSSKRLEWLSRVQDVDELLSGCPVPAPSGDDNTDITAQSSLLFPFTVSEKLQEACLMEARHMAIFESKWNLDALIARNGATAPEDEESVAEGLTNDDVFLAGGAPSGEGNLRSSISGTTRAMMHGKMAHHHHRSQSMQSLTAMSLSMTPSNSSGKASTASLPQGVTHEGMLQRLKNSIFGKKTEQADDHSSAGGLVVMSQESPQAVVGKPVSISKHRRSQSAFTFSRDQKANDTKNADHSELPAAAQIGSCEYRNKTRFWGSSLANEDEGEGGVGGDSTVMVGVARSHSGDHEGLLRKTLSSTSSFFIPAASASSTSTEDDYDSSSSPRGAAVVYNSDSDAASIRSDATSASEIDAVLGDETNISSHQYRRRKRKNVKSIFNYDSSHSGRDTPTTEFFEVSAETRSSAMRSIEELLEMVAPSKLMDNYNAEVEVLGVELWPPVKVYRKSGPERLQYVIRVSLSDTLTVIRNDGSSLNNDVGSAAPRGLSDHRSTREEALDLKSNRGSTKTAISLYQRFAQELINRTVTNCGDLSRHVFTVRRDLASLCALHAELVTILSPTDIVPPPFPDPFLLGTHEEEILEALRTDEKQRLKIGQSFAYGARLRKSLGWNDKPPLAGKKIRDGELFDSRALDENIEGIEQYLRNVFALMESLDEDALATKLSKRLPCTVMSDDGDRDVGVVSSTSSKVIQEALVVAENVMVFASDTRPSQQTDFDGSKESKGGNEKDSYGLRLNELADQNGIPTAHALETLPSFLTGRTTSEVEMAKSIPENTETGNFPISQNQSIDSPHFQSLAVPQDAQQCDSSPTNCSLELISEKFGFLIGKLLRGTDIEEMLNTHSEKAADQSVARRRTVRYHPLTSVIAAAHEKRDHSPLSSSYIPSKIFPSFAAPSKSLWDDAVGSSGSAVSHGTGGAYALRSRSRDEAVEGVGRDKIIRRPCWYPHAVGGLHIKLLIKDDRGGKLSLKSDEEQLRIQRARCMGCGEPLVTGFLGFDRNFLPCRYYGGLFCRRWCHLEERRPIPHRVLLFWDHKPHRVCRQAEEFLRYIWHKPVLEVRALNPLLYEGVPAMRLMRNIRERASALLMSTLEADAEAVASSLLKTVGPDGVHLAIGDELYSMRDLVGVHSGITIQIMEDIIANLQCIAPPDYWSASAGKKAPVKKSHNAVKSEKGLWSHGKR